MHRQPFAAGTVRRARLLAVRYQFLVGWDEEVGEHVARCLELPNCVGSGASPGAALAEATGNAVMALAYLIEKGVKLPVARRGVNLARAS